MAFIRGPVPVVFERVVSATPAQFERDLRAAWPAATGSASAGVLQVRAGDAALAIELTALPARRIGLIELPQLRVCYRFACGGEPARRRLLAALDRAMQRGGG